MSLQHAGGIRPLGINDSRVLIPLTESITLGLEVIYPSGYEWTTYGDQMERGQFGAGVRESTPFWSFAMTPAVTDGGDFIVLGMTYDSPYTSQGIEVVPLRFTDQVSYEGEMTRIPIFDNNGAAVNLHPFGSNRWVLVTELYNGSLGGNSAYDLTFTDTYEVRGAGLGVLTYANGSFDYDPIVWVPSFQQVKRAEHIVRTDMPSYYGSPRAAVTSNKDGRNPYLVYLGDDELLVTWHSQYSTTNVGTVAFSDMVRLRYNGPGDWEIVDVDGDPTHQGNIYELVPESRFVLERALAYDDLMGMSGSGAEDWIGFYWNAGDVGGPPQGNGTGKLRFGAVGGGGSTWGHAIGYAPGGQNPVFVKVDSGPTDRMSVMWADVNWNNAWISGGGQWGNEGGYFFRATPDFSSYWLCKRDGFYFVENGSAELVRSFGTTIADGDYFEVEFGGPFMLAWIDDGSFGGLEFGVHDARNENETLHGIMDRFGASKPMYAYLDVNFYDALGNQVELSVIEKAAGGLEYGAATIVSPTYGANSNYTWGCSLDQRLGFFMAEEPLGWYFDIDPPLYGAEVLDDGSVTVSQVLEAVADNRPRAVARAGSLIAANFSGFLPSDSGQSIDFFGDPNYVTFDDSGQRVRFTGVR